MKKANIIWYLLTLMIYFAVSYSVVQISTAGEGIMVYGKMIPAASFTGVLSSLSNICIIILVVSFGKAGFITALVILLGQFPFMISSLVIRNNAMVLPGIFGDLLTILAIIIIYRRNRKIDRFQEVEVKHLKDRQKLSQRLFEQTATALVTAIDAKDTYSHGHSVRVAEYSEKIARQLGKNDEECYRIYYAALLHDVGKIGISNQIINKKGKLTAEEYEIIKEHPAKGNQILSSINEFPYLSIGAHYHHERYDGKGYPDGLKGEDIPEIARIISVADAYDAMSSNRSYRTAIPQQLIREEIVKGAGSQFDPEFAGIMKSLIDQDPEYEMRERDEVSALSGRSELDCEDFGSEMSDGIPVNDHITKIHLSSRLQGGSREKDAGGAFIVFDSLDGRVHDEEKTAAELNYFEYGRIWLDGRTECSGARKIQTDLIRQEKSDAKDAVYDVEAVKYKDHVLISINGGRQDIEVTIALPDSSRYVYIAVTGKMCHIGDLWVSSEQERINGDYITRIADEISYIDEPEGDMPNLQVDGVRTAATAGIPVISSLMVSFHSRSLPTARLIWHCPYLVIFSSSDGKVGGEGYREYALIRLDGENLESGEYAKNILQVDKADDFKGWDAWKEYNKGGMNVAVAITRSDKEICLSTENFGISIVNTTTLLDEARNVYFAITGDQCAITGIRIR